MFSLQAEAPEPRGQRGQLPPPPPFAYGGQRGQPCPFLIAIELFYHPNNFASDVRNVIGTNHCWSSLVVIGHFEL